MAHVNLPSNPAKRHGELDRTVDRRDAALPGERATARAEPPLRRRIVAGTFQFVLVVAILALGYAAYSWLIATAPRAERKPPVRVARLVEVVPVVPAAAGPVIEAWGEVVAAQTLVVRPEVSGTLTWVDPEVTAGGRLSAGQDVARFDDADLSLALTQAENAIAGIDARIQIERGQAEIGKRELTRLSRNLTDKQRALVLRQPQMAQLQAERAAAVALRDQAANALARTVIRAPFDAIVLSENVAPGSVVTQGADAATIVASDRFHVTLAVPASALDWLKFDGTQLVKLTQPGVWPPGEHRLARIVRLNSELTATGRMAEVIVEIPDPLALEPMNTGKPVLLLGAFVRGTIEGRPVDGAVIVDRAHLRDGDTVWVMNGEDRLEVREVDVAWRGPDNVLVTSGVGPGERIVTTTLATFAPGMELRTRSGDPDTANGDTGKAPDAIGQPDGGTPAGNEQSATARGDKS